MLVFWKEKLAFLSQSKTASEAFEAALTPHADIVITSPPQLKHATIQRYNRFLRPMFTVAGAEDIETMALIREPIDWLNSWYRYRLRPSLASSANSTVGISFDAFVEAYMQRPRPAFAEVGSQAKFLTGGKGDMTIDHLFRYESMPDVITFLEDRLQMEITLPQMNVSPVLNLTLDPEIETRVRAFLTKEYEIWNSLG
ncbi:gamma-glutamyl kinase [Pseudaestuariivita rosea]|uniref:gamma-glutamyl kinase n=1 Tax=Pseudaestuariivita rosea TaxID=2763263 RepID=UPI001ABAF3C8|nr:gamma-glutamyl kinase [Pseudaestuariivita rosea]